jgi:hypothetical protein
LGLKAELHARMAALLRMASPKNHTQPGSHPISSTIDVPQHLSLLSYLNC